MTHGRCGGVKGASHAPLASGRAAERRRRRVLTSILDIQVAYITRVMAAFEKVTPRTKGHRFGRARRAARKQAITRLVKRGYSARDAAQIVDDAHDVFLLEAAVMRGASRPHLSRSKP